MKKSLRTFLTLSFLFGTTMPLFAQSGGEDSCKAYMNVMPDHIDPLLVHFQWAGTVPINSFQFLGMWDFGDGFTSNDSCPDHMYSQPGTYTVCLSFSICIGGGLSCHDDTCQTVTVGTIAGIENSDGGLHQFYVYPNPVQSSFFIRSDSHSDVEIIVRNPAGQIVYRSIAKNDAPVDAARLANGIYFIEAHSGSAVLQRKMVVQN